MTVPTSWLPWIAHRRAERLVEDRLDALPCSEHDEAWLEAHLAGCARCARFEQSRRRLRFELAALAPIEAPPGFVERVRFAAAQASARPKAGASPEPVGPWGRRMAVAAVAAAVAGLAIFAPMDGGDTVPDTVRVGGATSPLVEEAPNFVVRSPSLGSARMRRLARSLVRAHQGEILAAEDGHLKAVDRKSTRLNSSHYS